MHVYKRMIRHKGTILFFIIYLFLLTAAVHSVSAKSSEIKWNDTGIRWEEYEKGLDNAWRENKPVILIFYTDWCPACKKYGSVFQDKRVIMESNRFIMVRINKDNNKKLSLKYGEDGTYIPRTIALYPNGRVMHEIYDRKNHKYYIGTKADSLLALMKDAYSKLQ